MTDARPRRVALVRGHQTNSWHLRPWRHLPDRFDAVVLRTRRSWFDTASLGLSAEPAPALRDLLPSGRIGDALARVPGDRYLRPREALAGAAIVHSQDLGFWYSMQAAKYKRELGYKLVLTVWETIPLLGAYRNVRTRPYRERVLAATDLFLATSERARKALVLEGADPARIQLCPPGVDMELFGAEPSAPQPTEHLIVSPGRLVWEKGHQDLLRAVATLRRGLVETPTVPRVLIVGAGPEKARLTRYAAELSISDLVEVRSEIPYADMPALYGRASCLVLGSLPVWFWEEQFGMVLAEAMAARLPIVAASSGAIPEVVDESARTFPAGGWPELASLLAEEVLTRPPGTRATYEQSTVDRYSAPAFAERLATAYDELLAS